MSFDNPDVYYIMDIIKEIRATDRIDRKISDVLIVIGSIDEEVLNKTDGKKLKKKYEKLMKDHLFRRSVNVRNKMMTDTEESLCYLGEDYITDIEHTYDTEIEEQIIQLEDEIRTFLSQVIKELVSDEINL